MYHGAWPCSPGIHRPPFEMYRCRQWGVTEGCRQEVIISQTSLQGWTVPPCTKAKQGVEGGNLEGSSWHCWDPYPGVAMNPLPTLLQQGGQG